MQYRQKCFCSSHGKFLLQYYPPQRPLCSVNVLSYHVQIQIQPDLAKDIRLQSVLTKHGQQMQLAQFSGILKVKNHKYELTAAEREPSQQLIGQMKSKELLIKNLEDLGFQDIEIGKDELIIPGTGCHFKLPRDPQTAGNSI